MRKRTVAMVTGAFAATVGLAVVPVTVMADQVILDDLIVDGSACIGQDCVNGESFGFDTIRIKENNLRIKAQDTSSTASFPTQDWQITFNDSTNGGTNKFAIDAIDPVSRTMFTIVDSAQAHALFLTSNRAGFGTNTPVTEIHVVDGDTPTVRLEQDGSSGFTQQTWDLAGNETNFFVRDATNGSQLPFRIQPGADSNTLFLENTNDVGIGTSSPEEELHITEDTSPRIRLQATTASTSGNQTATMGLNGAGDFIVQTDSGVKFRLFDSSVLRLAPLGTAPATAGFSDGDLYIDNSGAVCILFGGTWNNVGGPGTCA